MASPKQSAQQRQTASHEQRQRQARPGLQSDATQPSNPDHPQRQAEKQVSSQQQRRDAIGLDEMFSD